MTSQLSVIGSTRQIWSHGTVGRYATGLARGANEQCLVQEEGTPFPGFRAVGIGAAAEFKLAVEFFEQAGLAKHGDEIAFVTEEPTGWI